MTSTGSFQGFSQHRTWCRCGTLYIALPNSGIWFQTCSTDCRQSLFAPDACRILSRSSWHSTVCMQKTLEGNLLMLLLRRTSCICGMRCIAETNCAISSFLMPTTTRKQGRVFCRVSCCIWSIPCGLPERRISYTASCLEPWSGGR